MSTETVVVDYPFVLYAEANNNVMEVLVSTLVDDFSDPVMDEVNEYLSRTCWQLLTLIRTDHNRMAMGEAWSAVISFDQTCTGNHGRTLAEVVQCPTP